MSLFSENRFFSELPCGENISYLLNENSLFSPTEYKVLQTQDSTSLAKCMKLLHNGNIQLFYFTENCKSLSSLLPTMSAETFLTVAANLITSVLVVKSNGFLLCHNLDIRYDYIFVDPATLTVRLIYLPLTEHRYDDIYSFESALRSSLIRLIQGLPALASPKTEQFAVNLSNAKLKLENLLAVQTARIPAVTPPKVEPKAAGRLSLVSMNAPKRVVLEISKDEFLIGKSKESVDGFIGFNAAISRNHCKISRKDGKYFVTDLHSANGTFLNKLRLEDKKAYALHNGDVLRLANLDFRIRLT